jgi:hypothetical protein
MVAPGCRDTALRCAGCRPVIVVGLEEHHRPRAIEGAHPRWRLERAKRGNPVWVQPSRAGRPTARRAQLPGGNRMTKEANAGRRKAAETVTVLISALLLMVTDNRPDTDPCGPARKRADVVR